MREIATYRYQDANLRLNLGEVDAEYRGNKD